MKLLLRTLIIWLLSTSLASAASLIRDAETEGVLRDLATPIFVVDGLTPENVHIYILNDDTLNAFVAGGQNIFIHTGLLTYSDNPETLMGVIAHECGHIVGGHLMLKDQDASKLTAASALGYILGAATAIAGAPAAGQAIIMGSENAIGRTFLTHTRAQESAADQSALLALGKLGYSPEGLLGLLDDLGREQSQTFGKVDPYLQTHPLSRERVDHIEAFMAQHPEHKQLPADLRRRFKLAVVKVAAFLDKPSKTLHKFPKNDQSAAARYARAVAYYKIPELGAALKEINSLIAEFPKNPFYHETKGQILYENSHVDDAIKSYEKAEELLPNNALMKIELATVLIAKEDSSLLDKAITLLQQATNLEPNNANAWQQLGVAYGRKNELGLSYLSLTEAALLTHNIKDAKAYADYAEHHLKAGSPGAIRLIDLKREIEDAN